MNKKKKVKPDLRIEIIKTLEGRKKFRLSWEERIDCDVLIEAKDEDEAEELFYSNRFNLAEVNEGQREYCEDSLYVEREI